MRVLILGGNGMLGHKLNQICSERFDTWITIRSKKEEYLKYSIFNQNNIFDNIDIQNLDLLRKIISSVRPEVIINAIGIINQVPQSKDPILSIMINSLFPHRLVELSNLFNFRLIHISTDCVFSGKVGMYKETDIPDPPDLYGRSKLLGEVVGNNVLTLRTSMIGRELVTTNGLVEWFLSNRGSHIKGYKNAIYTGFTTIILSRLIADIIDNYPFLSGLYHLSSDPISKFDLLTIINDYYRTNIEIEPYYDFQCDRSLDSTKIRKLINFKPSTWKNMILAMKEDATPYEELRRNFKNPN